MIGCHTCPRAYHLECMTSTLDLTSLPELWYCPLCVERNWHLPASIETPIPSPNLPPLSSREHRSGADPQLDHLSSRQGIASSENNGIFAGETPPIIRRIPAVIGGYQPEEGNADGVIPSSSAPRSSMPRSETQATVDNSGPETISTKGPTQWR